MTKVLAAIVLGVGLAMLASQLGIKSLTPAGTPAKHSNVQSKVPTEGVAHVEPASQAYKAISSALLQGGSYNRTCAGPSVRQAEAAVRAEASMTIRERSTFAASAASRATDRAAGACSRLSTTLKPALSMATWCRR